MNPNNSSGSGGSPQHQQKPGPSSAYRQISPPPSPGLRIIQELFQDYNELGYKQALSELDAAMEQKCPIIVIEPHRLGDETTRWIAVGNFLHKTIVISGATACLAIGLAPLHPNWYLWSPFTITCLGCYVMYSLSWQRDPCCKYQVEQDQKRLSKLLNSVTTTSSSVVVLTRRDDSRRRILHTTVAVATVCVVGSTLYKIYWGH